MPSTANEYYKRGIESIQKKDWQGALVEFDEALKLEPNNIESLQGKAMSLLWLHKHEEAITIILSALALNNMSSDLHYLASIIYLAQKDLDHAQERLLDALLLDPSSATIYHTQGVMMLKKKNYSEAIKYLDIAIDKTPEDCQYHYTKGTVLMKSENWQDAKLSFQKIIELEPSYTGAEERLNYCDAKLLGVTDQECH